MKSFPTICYHILSFHVITSFLYLVTYFSPATLLYVRVLNLFYTEWSSCLSHDQTSYRLI